MKRGAERQIARTDRDTEEDDSEEPGQGFRKAEETVLAGRKIRGLPKRLGGAPAATPSPMTFGGAPGAAAPPSRFGTFAGFGAPATSSTGFTFQAPKESSEFPVVPTFPSPSSSPLASATATPATKTFASFLTSAPAVAPPPPTVPTPSMPQSDDATMDTTDSDELEFYVSLRGLNQSFLEAVTKQVTDDPFFDLSVFFERYTAHRDDVQTKFDAGKGISKIKVPSAAVAPAVPATNGSAKPLGMPAVPATFTGFGSFKPGPTSSSPSTGGGFTPKLDSAPTTKSSGFSFPAPAGPSADVSKSSGAFGLVAPPKPAEDAGKKSHFTLAAPAAPSSDVPTSSVSKPTFAFGGSTAPSTDASRSAPSKPAFSFGAPSAPSAFTFGSSGAASTTTKPEAGKFGFGAGGFGFATKAGSGSAAENSAPASNTTSLFGSPTHTPGGDSGMNPFSVLGKPGAGTGSLGNPVGFTFGSPARTPDAAPASAIFAVPASEDDAASVNKSDSEDAPPPVLGVSVHDAPGEGEEDEEAVHEIRSKLYQLSKRSVDGSVAEYWADLGIGILRLKKHKESSARRMLMRNSSTGKIIINFSLYSSLEPKQTDKVVSFIGHDEKGRPSSFRVRMKTAEDALALQNAIEHEVAAVAGAA